MPPLRLILRPLLACGLLPLAACSSTTDLSSYLSPYRIDVRQGNLVTQEMVDQLKPGLSRDQVRFILGTPLIADVFHADRWDYVYRFQPGHGRSEQRRLSVFFVDDRLARVEGDVIPAEGHRAVGEAARPSTRIIDIPAADAAASRP